MSFFDEKPSHRVIDKIFFFHLPAFFGLRCIRPGGKAWIGYVYILLLLSTYYVLFHVAMDHAEHEFITLQLYLSSIRLIRAAYYFNIVYFPIMIFASVRNDKKRERIYLKLREVDESLRYSNVLVTDDENSRLGEVKRILWAILLTIVISLTNYFGLMNVEWSHHRLHILSWFLNLLPELINALNNCLFVTLLSRIRRRFQAMNRLILDTGKKSQTFDFSGNVNNVLKLRSFRNIYNKLRNLARDCNDAYDVTLFWTIILSSIYFCLYFNVIYESFGTDFKEGPNLILGVNWAFFNLAKLSYLVHCCEMTTFQTKLSADLLHREWTDTTDYKALRQEIKKFRTSVLYGKLQFTACNWFVVDYFLLKMILVSSIIYVTVVNKLAAMK